MGQEDEEITQWKHARNSHGERGIDIKIADLILEQFAVYACVWSKIEHKKNKLFCDEYFSDGFQIFPTYSRRAQRNTYSSSIETQIESFTTNPMHSTSFDSNSWCPNSSLSCPGIGFLNHE